MYVPCPLLLSGGGCVPSGQRPVTGDTLEGAALSLADPVTMCVCVCVCVCVCGVCVCVCVDKKISIYCVFS